MVAECHQTAVGSSPDYGTLAQLTKVSRVSGTRHKVGCSKFGRGGSWLAAITLAWRSGLVLALEVEL
jgi:hypothetical protein